MKYKFSDRRVVAKVIILLTALSLISVSVYAQSVKSKKQYKPVNTADFMDSARHWRDITDAHKIIMPLPRQARYPEEQITEIADNILLYQCNNGGWPKNYDMRAILTEKQKAALLKAKDDDQTTFDNGTTYSQTQYLAEAFYRTRNEKYKEASLKGIKFMLEAQYPNGGWPQFYPDTSGYRKFITFNDGAMIGIMKVFQHIIERKPYFSFVSNSLRDKVEKSFNKGIECILKCQIKENGTLTAWCQQNDNIDFRPQHARTFELPSVCGNESTGITLFLMSLEHPDKAIVNSVQSAVRWFNESQIHGIKVVTVKAPTVTYKYRTTSTDKIVVKDPAAPRIWARFYQLGTNRPFFCDRNGVPVYKLSEVGRERRDGYGWYTYLPEEVLRTYPSWQKKWAPNNNVLNRKD